MATTNTTTNKQNVSTQNTKYEAFVENVEEVEVIPTEDELQIQEYVDTPYTYNVVLGQGVYVQPLYGNDTYETRKAMAFTTEPVVKINEDGFSTTDIRYVRVTA